MSQALFIRNVCDNDRNHPNISSILLILRWRKKHNDKAEKCVWIIGHYMVFAAAILLSNARRGNDLMITTCVFVWADFAVYLLELAIYFDLARRHI